MPSLFLLLLSVCLLFVFFVFCCRKSYQIRCLFFYEPKKARGEIKTNGYANQVDEEHSQSASLF